MSFTYTQTASNPNFGTLNLNSASLYLRQLFGTGNKASLFFDSNVAAKKMSFGPDDSSNALVSSDKVIVPSLQVSGLNANGSIVTTDAAGNLQKTNGFTYLNSMLTVADATVTGNLVVNGNVTVHETSTVLIEDPIVQVGLSNISSSQEVGFIFSANASSLGSNVAMGYLPSNNVFAIGQTIASSSGTNLGVMPSGNLAVKIYGTLNVTNGITQNGNPLASRDDITLELAIQNSGHQTYDTINFLNGISSHTVTIGGATTISGDIHGNIKLGTAPNNGTHLLNSNVLVLNEHGGVVDSGITISDISSGPGGSSNLQSVMLIGGLTDQTMTLSNVTTGLVVSSNIEVGGNVTASTVISDALNANTAAFNILLANQLEVADIYANGDNINFYGPTMRVSGNITAQSFTGNGAGLTNVTTVSGLQKITENGATTNVAVSFTNSGVAVNVPNGIVKSDSVLANTLDVRGSATFDGVTTVSVLKFTPGGVDPSVGTPAALYTGTSGGLINVTMTGVTYGSNTVTNLSGATVSGLNITGLSPNSHLYLYVSGTQTFATPTDGYVYLGTPVVGSGKKVMYHAFNVGGTTFVDMTSVS